MKHGPRTTEFWATIATAAVIVANDIFAMGLSQEAVMSVVAAVAGYALSRGVAKRGADQ